MHKKFDPTAPWETHCSECSELSQYAWKGDALPDGAALVGHQHGLLAPGYLYDAEAPSRYRYTLTREWVTGHGQALWIMLNPSTADESNDDPTIRRVISFSARWGVAGCAVVNLYALRATRPVHLWEAADPVGPQNDLHLGLAMTTAQQHGAPVVAAWGANARADRVAWLTNWATELEVPLMCLGTTLGGAPRHPLYVRGDQPLIPWKGQQHA